MGTIDDIKSLVVEGVVWQELRGEEKVGIIR